MWRSSLGYVTVVTSGVPIRATINESSPGVRLGCQTLFFQQHPDNTGVLYVCDRTSANIASGLGILAQIPAPTLNGSGVAISLPCAAVTVPDAPVPFNAADFYIDADNSGEKCLVSRVVR